MSIQRKSVLVESDGGSCVGTVSLGELAKAQEHTYNAGYAAALRDAVEAVKAYADKTHKHVGMFKCWPESGDRCDITAALRVAVVKIQELGGER